MDEKIVIRRYLESDKEAVRALHKSALSSAGAFDQSGIWDTDLNDIPHIYLENRGEFLIAVLGKNIVGMGAFRRKDDETAEIKRMRIGPNFQRKGMGKALLSLLEEKAKVLGYKKLVLDTTTVQTAAQQFYLQCGYRETKRAKVGKFDCIFYEKEIWPINIRGSTIKSEGFGELSGRSSTDSRASPPLPCFLYVSILISLALP